MFELIFLVIYFFGTEIWFQLAKEQSEIEIPFHRGVILCSTFFHLIIFITSIRMFGVWVGISIGLLHLLSISHALVGWVFSLPSVIRTIKHFNTYRRAGMSRMALGTLETPSSIIKYRTVMLILVVIMGFIHLLFAFINYEYKGALESYLWTNEAILVLSGVVLGLGLLKFLIYRILR
ncbi:MAG TPA: hypothetical protein PLR26_07640 [Bacilli bacterium]|nr:hypothetical protein [Bacilli bacterium]